MTNPQPKGADELLADELEQKLVKVERVSDTAHVALNRHEVRRISPPFAALPLLLQMRG